MLSKLFIPYWSSSKRRLECLYLPICCKFVKKKPKKKVAPSKQYPPCRYLLRTFFWPEPLHSLSPSMDVSSVETKLRKSIEEGDYYHALNLYKSLYFRFVDEKWNLTTLGFRQRDATYNFDNSSLMELNSCWNTGKLIQQPSSLCFWSKTTPKLMRL